MMDRVDDTGGVTSTLNMNCSQGEIILFKLIYLNIKLKKTHLVHVYVIQTQLPFVAFPAQFTSMTSRQHSSVYRELRTKFDAEDCWQV